MERFICEPGTVVRCKAGRETGQYFLVIACEGMELLLADGKRRPLAKPKRKNPLHVQQTRQKLSLEGLTDKALRGYLAPLNESVSRPKTKRNQIRKEVIDDVEAGCN